MSENPLLILGIGQVGSAAAARCTGSRRVIGTTRDPKKIFDMFHSGIEPIVLPWPSADVIAPLAQAADVLVTFPPDGTTDAILAPACLQAASVIYISSTGVFGKTEGIINDETQPDFDDENARLRIEAEKIWRSIGANILRAPGIYGASSGLHKRLKEGTFKIPGDGSRMVSRIHIDDLVSIIFALFASGKQQETFVVGDHRPASHLEVVNWLCEKMSIPAPDTVPIESAHHTLRGNRQVNGTRVLQQLNIQLKYPTYKEGYEQVLSDDPANL